MGQFSTALGLCVTGLEDSNTNVICFRFHLKDDAFTMYVVCVLQNMNTTVKFLRVTIDIEGQLNKFSIMLIGGAHIDAMALLVIN